MKIKIKKILYKSFTCLLLLFAPYKASAQTSGQEALKFLDDTAQKSGLNVVQSGEAGTLNLIGNIINALLGLIGIIFFVQVFWAGFRWMTAQGNDEIIKESKDTIKTAVIGIVVVFLAFVITNFTMNQIQKITSQGTNVNHGQTNTIYCQYTDEVGTTQCVEINSASECNQYSQGNVVENCTY